MDLDSTLKLNNDVEMPVLGLGVWKATPEETTTAVHSALKHGYRHIDTAWIYGNEAAVGQALKSSGIPREEVFLTTKLWRDHHDQPAKAIDDSLKKLDVDYVDLYLSHFPAKDTRIEAYKTMEELLTQGKTKAIGVSNYTIRHLEELIKSTSIIPSVNQVEIHVFLQQKDLVEFCKEKNIKIEAYSPLAHAKKLNDSSLSTIGNKYGKSSAQIMIRWCIEKKYITIPKSTNDQRIKENCDVFDFSLDEEDMDVLDRLDSDFRTCWDPTDAP